MANITTQAPVAAPFGFAQRFWNWLGNAMVRLAENNARVRQAEALMSLSDQELAERGMKREDIAKVVFADSAWL